jgi:signal transduction histidine kinase
MQSVLARSAPLGRFDSTLVFSRLVLGASAVAAAVGTGVLGVSQGIAVFIVTGIAMFLLGYVADRARRARQESEQLHRIVTRAYAQPGVRGLLQTTFEEFSALLGSNVMLIAARDRRRQEAFAWEVRRAASADAPHIITLDEVKEADLFFVPAGQVWRLEIADGQVTGRTVVGDGADAGEPAGEPGAMVMSLSPRSLVAITVALWDRWDATIICVDPDARAAASQLRFALAIAAELRAPALNAFDLSRLRNRVIAAHRARLARDLHDGILQSLIGLELKTHALRERIIQKDPDTAARLGQIQRALRKEATEARRLMQDLRAGVVEPHQLAEAMAAAVMKFQHDTGVVTTFEADDQQNAVSARVSAELTRILQEALSNVRRHSRARHVAVRLAQADGGCRLTIEDDGAGFSFAGRRTLDELAQSRSGPSTIMERVRLLGGQLAVDSTPTRGARLEIVVPSGGRQ